MSVTPIGKSTPTMGSFKDKSNSTCLVTSKELGATLVQELPGSFQYVKPEKSDTGSSKMSNIIKCGILATLLAILAIEVALLVLTRTTSTTTNGPLIGTTTTVATPPLETTSTTTTATTTMTTMAQDIVLRYLIATGGYHYGSSVKTEILDLSDSSLSCLIEEEEDISNRFRSTGGVLGTIPVICGGYASGTYLNECLLYGTTSQVITMNSIRVGHSSVALNNSMLWILGGSNHGGTSSGYHLDSTEFITTNGAFIGPTIPAPVSDSCAVKFPGNGNVYLIGGKTPSGFSNNVWMSNPSNNFAFEQVPSLITARGYHTCGSMSIGAKSIIVAAGGQPGFLKSVEILDPLSNQWMEGPELPYGIVYSAMAPSPDGNGVILVGGLSGNTLDSILELKSDGQGWVGSWTTLPTKLQYARRMHIVIPMFMKRDICELSGIIPDQ